MIEQSRYLTKSQTIYSCKFGRCPKCGRNDVQLTEHHIFKRSVFGNNNKTVYLCRDCHNKLEEKVRIMESMILRLFKPCYSNLYYRFMYNDILENRDIIPICTKRISSFLCNSKNYALIRRIMQNCGLMFEKKRG